ncbi:hypothetical protein RIF29_36872 [Crotalaria pallida]|uniref:RING-type domain-containing protein n=1 Tax=Crotalaria pallida TaxID=3830 RepID=A0AAN9HW05_CROPI
MVSDVRQNNDNKGDTRSEEKPTPTTTPRREEKQTQYPSNVLFLNSRNGQEGRDYSVQQQPQAGLNQSHPLLFNNGATSSRKRGREEEVAAVGVGQTAPRVMNPLFSLQSQQSQPPQLIDITQLHHHPHNHGHQQQNGSVSTGLGLSFGGQQHRSPGLFSLFSECLNSQIKQQRDEIHNFIQSQGEQMRQGLAEKRQRHLRTLLNAADESVARRLREKEAQMEKVTRRNAELEARAAQLSVESQVLQAKAKAQEATAASLQAQLEHAIMMSHERRAGGEEGGALSCAGGEAEDAESAYVDPERVMAGAPKCRGCDNRVASVVVLPCRHLCVCTECDRHFRACPVCLTVKNSSIQVCLS